MTDAVIDNLSQTANNVTEDGQVLPVVGFSAMTQGTQADYDLVGGIHEDYVNALPDRLLQFCTLLDGDYSGYKISRGAHGLQTATRAEADGADEEMIVTALLHDIGDVLAPESHGAFIAAILKPYVREECVWVADKHPVFQYAYYGQYVGVDPELRAMYRGHPYYESCLQFCEKWDQASFDPHYPTRDLAYFAPMVHRVFAAPRYQPWGNFKQPGA